MSENQTPNYDEKHYQTLISIFKWMLAAIGVIVAAALWLINSNLSDLKGELQTELQSLKEEIKEVKSDADKTITETKEESNAQLELLRQNSTHYLDFTKQITEMQISILREDAKNLALSTARAKVEEAFRANNIQYMIEDIARKELGDKLDKIVDEEIKKTTEVIKYTTFFTQAYDYIRWGDRAYIDIIDSISQNHQNEVIRDMATGLLIQKGRDYDEHILKSEEIKKGKPFLTQSSGEVIFKNGKLMSNDEKEFSTPQLLDIIYHSNDLYTISLAFMSLRNIHNVDLKTFDMQAVREWEKNQSNNK